MIIKHSYPNLRKEMNIFFFLKFLFSILCLISIIVCTIVNIIFNEYPWVLYVIGGEIIFYYIFFRKDLIDNTIIKRIIQIVIAICIYLKIIDLINHTTWSWFVDSIILFSLLILQLLVYIIGIKVHRRKIIPLFGLSIASIIIGLLGVFKIIRLTWPIIVLGSLGTIIFIVLITFYNKTTCTELRKYFNIR